MGVCLSGVGFVFGSVARVLVKGVLLSLAVVFSRLTKYLGRVVARAVWVTAVATVAVVAAAGLSVPAWAAPDPSTGSATEAERVRSDCP